LALPGESTLGEHLSVPIAEHVGAGRAKGKPGSLVRVLAGIKPSERTYVYVSRFFVQPQLLTNR